MSEAWRGVWTLDTAEVFLLANWDISYYCDGKVSSPRYVQQRRWFRWRNVLAKPSLHGHLALARSGSIGSKNDILSKRIEEYVGLISKERMLSSRFLSFLIS